MADYYGHAYGWGGYGEADPPPVAARTLTVHAEDRTWVIEAEDRTLTVEAEDRTLAMEAA